MRQNFLKVAKKNKEVDMKLQKESIGFEIITTIEEYPDWDNKEKYIEFLKKANCFKEADELDLLSEGDFYDLLYQFHNSFSPLLH